MKCKECGAAMQHRLFDDWVWNVNDGHGGEEYQIERGEWVCTCGCVISDYEDEYEFPEDA